MIPSNISDAACDRLISAAFQDFPEANGDEIALLLTHVVEIFSDEIRTAVERERERWTTVQSN